jgi:uncharacterized damage-inducible protein DinB
MAGNILEKLFEHNNWANLDAEPHSATLGSIRLTLLHLVASQQGYLSLLTLPVEARRRTPPPFAELQKAASLSGEGLLALARDEPSTSLKTQLQTTDGYFVEPWVVMVQAINHATEHREQIKSMLSALGGTPPDLDGWDYGAFTNALIPPPT